MRTARSGGLVRAASRVGGVLVFGVLPIAAVTLVLAGTIGAPTFLFDFHGDLYSAGVAILHGHDPYRAGFLARLAALAAAGGHPTTTFAVPVYPAADLLAATPLALLPYTAAGLAFTALGIAALIGGLRLLGVRDPRCYGAAFLSWPVLHSLRLGQVNELLVLCLALLWHYRDRVVRPAAAAAVAISAKLLLWPVAAFLLFERRYRTAALTAALAALGTLASWALIGFAGFATYPRMLGDLSRVEAAAGVSPVSLVTALGGSRTLGTCLGVAIAGALIALAWRLSRSEASPTGGTGARRALALLIVAALAASPLVWPHYLTLLLVPIALISPSFGPLWLVPLLAWAAPVELTDGHAAQIAVYVAIELIVTIVAAAPLLNGRIPRRRLAFKNRSGPQLVTVRLGSGLESTSSRSYIAAQRPNKGPEEPHYTQVEDLMPRTANRPT
jgi:hypothetical protein